MTFIFYVCLSLCFLLHKLQVGLLLHVVGRHNVSDVPTTSILPLLLLSAAQHHFMLLPHAVICSLCWQGPLMTGLILVQRSVKTQSTWLILQAFNKGLFDFLIATDDPSKEGTDKPGPPPTDSSNAAVVSQQPEAAGEAAEEATGTPGADNNVEDAAPDHAWTEAAAATAQSSKVKHRQGISNPNFGFCALLLCCLGSLFWVVGL